MHKRQTITAMIVRYPQSFARFYDTIYHSLRDDVDNEYFQEEIRRSGKKVLEVGAGTGRLFINALTGGADIYGLDISESMLEILNEKLPPSQRYRVSNQNITDFRYDFRFNLVLAPFRVMMHLISKEEQLAAINNVYDHLESGGRFIFDVFVPDLRQLLTGLDNHVDFEGEYEPGQRIKRTVSTSPDLINQLITVSFTLEWDEDGLVKRDEWTLPMRFYFRYELEHLLERSKFREYKIKGDYVGNELDRNSKEFIVTCLKK
jgi:SAM-dependent methyltransferase